MKKLQSVNEVIQLIEAGKVLSLAGDERVLSQLPKGNWVAGTTPYFMGRSQGEFSQEKVYVDEIAEGLTQHKIMTYDKQTLPSFTGDRFDNGYSILVIPAFSQVHSDFALYADGYDHLYDNPVLGWVSGIDLDSGDTPKVYDGSTGTELTDKVVALHVELPSNKMPQLEIINIHKPDPDSPVIEFDTDAFEAGDCLIDGQKVNFAEYVSEHGIDTQVPLTSDYSGAIINTCIKEVNADDGKVHFYAPVFKGREYRFARPLADYAAEFASSLPQNKREAQFSCNCILNFLYGELKGKQAGLPGPITFGEIGYRLLNQTMTYLEVVDLDD
ncbi:hypothetical protein GZ77_11310 [Endozoicomonas montiporae]|uniref:Uncharacterized protein n=2 Tax=Endozoicomonas montiporae TaxID=1027273 RepID=A0A081N8S8_9GAMM|nr:hypothetical protein [Endozoicomonas montiporae]AMO55239.1 hypothetical protein EZMO1_1032 [Endozoicomonas montiporae CL-33]KEQ14851.1 hypothetical protein GZ77_11310 [Endozoicomonas montiporae]